MENADRKDIEACLEGDKDSYERLVRRYEPQITRLMWRFSRDQAECEELVQEVFVEAYFSLSSYRFRAPFLHWLRKIGTRVGLRFWKQKEKRKAFISLADFDVIKKEQTNEVDSQAAAQILHSLLARLPQTERLILTLMYFEQYSTRRIAEMMGSNRALIKMRALRARKKLRTIAERENLLEKLGWIH